MNLEARIHSIQKSGKKSIAGAVEKTKPSSSSSEYEFYDWIEKLFQKSGDDETVTINDSENHSVDERMTQEMDMIQEKVLEYQRYDERIWRVDILKLLVMRQAGRTAPYLFDFLSCLLPDVKKSRPLVYLGLVLSEEYLQQSYAEDTTKCILHHLSEDSSSAYRWLSSTLSLFSPEVLEKFLNELLRHISLDKRSKQQSTLMSLSSVAVLNLYRTHSSQQFHPLFNRIAIR
jgi:hypothetical protein